MAKQKKTTKKAKGGDASLQKAAEILGVTVEELQAMKARKEAEQKREAAVKVVNKLISQIPDDLKEVIVVRVKGGSTSSVRNTDRVHIPELNFTGTRTEAKIRILVEKEGMDEAEAARSKQRLANLERKYGLTVQPA